MCTRVCLDVLISSRNVCEVPYHSHITPSLVSLHWLLVRFRIIFKILTITFKAIHGHAPIYICQLISIKGQSVYNFNNSSSTTPKRTLDQSSYHFCLSCSNIVEFVAISHKERKYSAVMTF